MNGEQLAERCRGQGADILIVESDSVKGPVLDLGLGLIGSCRGDPNNVDVAAATARGIPVLRAPGRNADAVAELTVALLLAVNRGIVRADHDVRERPDLPRTGRSPTSASGPGSWPAAPPGSSASARSAAPAKWRLEGLGMRVIAYDPYDPEAAHHTPLDSS